MAGTVDFLQIYYLPEQKSEIFPFTTPYFNQSLTEFFENQIIADFVPSSQAEKIAVCSWSLRQKMTMRIPPRRNLSAEVLQEDFDVMSFTKNSPDHDMIGALDVWHPGSAALLRKIWAAVGLPFCEKPRYPIYQNAFCARADVYKSYVREFLLPAIWVMSLELKDECWQDSRYTVTTLNKPVDTERMRTLLGVPYYPLHPFLLERCFSIWIENKGLKIVYL